MNGIITDFYDMFRAEMTEIRARHNRSGRATIPEAVDTLEPTTALDLTGLTCSGGGIRSAAFCLGVLQGLQSRNVIAQMDYLSTVSGGGYIGTMLTVGMSRDRPASGKDGIFPFGVYAREVRHLRENSRYLVQNGLPGLIAALFIWLRGIAVNVVVVLLPYLLLYAALLIAIKPDTRKLVAYELLGYDLPGFLAYATPVTLVVACLLVGLLLAHALTISVVSRKKLLFLVSRALGLILFISLLLAAIELHLLLLRLAFESLGYITAADPKKPPTGARFFDFIFQWIKTLALVLAPVVAFVLPFLKQLLSKAFGSSGGTWGDLAKRIGSRVVLLVAASVVPVLIWLAAMQLAFWGVAVSGCHVNGQPAATAEALRACGRAQITENWPHAPALLRWLFGDPARFYRLKVPAIYVAISFVLFLFWPFFDMNANSLHRLYRNRLSSAFLIRRQDDDPFGPSIIEDDGFKLTDIKPTQGPYHLINTTLNLAGSKPGSYRHSRGADLFLFSRRFIGSHACGYVETEKAERVVEWLDIGTVMAISGAAAAPNMGMASIRPLSSTIAFLNFRLGAWVPQPQYIAQLADTPKSHWRTFPGPHYLLSEAFFKSGRDVFGRARWKKRGFVFLTDGGHIDNLGIYELLRRRCRLIVAIDADADPDLDAASLVRVERLARIDLNVTIRMDWTPIGARTRAVAEEIRGRALQAKNGPHVAVGLIDYPPAAGGTRGEQGALIYIKASMSGDENDYVLAYKAANPAFPHETTMEQLFSEEQFEAYRALGEHIARCLVEGKDAVAAFGTDKHFLLTSIRELVPSAAIA